MWLVVGGVVLWMVVREGSLDWVNPLSLNQKNFRQAQDTYEVIGFLPPWMVEKAVIYPEAMDQLIFLGVEAKANGDLVWDSQSNKLYSQTYLAMKRAMRGAGKQNVLGIKLFDDKKISTLMASAEARQNLVANVKKVIDQEQFDGVNIDFEYQGNPEGVLEEEFVSFIGELRQAIARKVSVDVFGNTVIKGNVEGLKNISMAADYVVVMAYDYHQPGSDYAGPVAPINSLPGVRSIMEVVDRIVALGLDRHKMILAYPLYGYEWKTVDTSFGSLARGNWGQMVSYQRAQNLLHDAAFMQTAVVNWDDLSMSPWMSFTATETAYRRVKVKKKMVSEPYSVDGVHQIYYENLRSLEAKFKLVTQSQLGGVGFWALGYEGNDAQVWLTLTEVLSGK